MLEGLPLAANLLLFAAAAAAVWFAAVRLAQRADAIATRTRLGHEMVGLLLLGGASALPELAVATAATLQGAPALTVSNLLGSAAVNVVLLALADAAIRDRALTSVQGSPRVLLIGVMGVLMMALVMAPGITGDVLLWGMGRWSWVLLLVFGGALWMMAHSQSDRAWQPTGEQITPSDAAEELRGQSLRRIALGAAAAVAVILFAGVVLARSGEAIAEETGLGTSYFGAVVLAMATSLPEASTVLAAVRLKRYGMAISDVLGAIVFNVAILVLVDALHPGGPVLLEAGRFASFGALLALVLACLFLVGLIERRDRTVGRLGVDSVVALLTYAAGLAVLYTLR